MNVKNVVLTGFMGTGKSTVGRLLAKKIGYAFVDTDELIEERTGCSVAEIFFQEGESAFRRWEAVVSQELASEERLVIASGGRLMLDSTNAAALARNALVICLTAEPEEIVARLAADGGRRPLITGKDPAARIRSLLAQRAQGYAQFHQICTSGKTTEQVVEEIEQCISAM